MKTWKIFLLTGAFLFILNIGYAQYFESSVYMNHRLIEDNDASVLDTVKFVDWQTHLIYDRRIPDYVDVELAIFQVNWSNGGSMEIQVLKEFFVDTPKDSVKQQYVFPFAHKTGQLPKFLLEGIDRLVLLKGEKRCSALEGSIYIHVDGQDDSTTDFVEEMLMHEGGHASMDSKLADLPDWKLAQQSDSMAVSKYASDNIESEDLTESIIAWLAVKYRAKRISTKDSIKIVETMPARIAFFDDLELEVYPFGEPSQYDYMYEYNYPDDSDYDGAYVMDFDEFIFKAALIFGVIMVLLVVRFVYRNAGF